MQNQLGADLAAQWKDLTIFLDPANFKNFKEMINDAKLILGDAGK